MRGDAAETLGLGSEVELLELSIGEREKVLKWIHWLRLNCHGLEDRWQVLRHVKPIDCVYGVALEKLWGLFGLSGFDFFRGFWAP
jgi:hypothetical protein